MKKRRYSIKFPATESRHLSSDQITFSVEENGQTVTLRFHDYSELYKRPGLYEQLFYDRLRCASPEKACEVLAKVLMHNNKEINELRVLDLGAGNGMVGERLSALGVSRLIGVDIEAEAQTACERDRPGIYDAYYVADLCQMDDSLENDLRDWHIDCLTCIAALGFGDIPTKAFINAFNLVQPGGWIVFNIKETFLQESDDSGFSRLVKYLLLTDILEAHHLERYRHRVSINGAPLFYYVFVGKKESNIGDSLAEDFESRPQASVD